jgi:hypothetical protein
MKASGGKANPQAVNDLLKQNAVFNLKGYSMTITA